MKKALVVTLVVILAGFVVSNALAYDFLKAIERGEWINYASGEPLTSGTENTGLWFENGTIFLDRTRKEGGGFVALYSKEEFEEIDFSFKFTCLERTGTNPTLFRIELFADDQTQPHWNFGSDFKFLELDFTSPESSQQKIVVTPKPNGKHSIADIDFVLGDGKEHLVRIKAESSEWGIARVQIWYDRMLMFDRELDDVNPKGGIMFLFTWNILKATVVPLNT